MPGWIIQGVRGEGKSLCAVYKAREYLKRGCPVATNLDLFVDKFLPYDNETISYRLPDKPRIEDFNLIGAAYDINYKFEDKNGLLILDELGTWLNSRTFKDKSRDSILNWLFLSRKLHWDVILLAQDFEMIDKQLRSTVCDYLVQASRTDRQKIPFIGRLLDKLSIDGNQKLEHVYEVYYGFHQQSNKPQECWKFVGDDLYDGYNTNQLFSDGNEILEIDGKAEIVDLRTTSTNLPASYLSGFIYKKEALKLIELTNKTYGDCMALRTSNKNSGFKVKVALLLIVGIAFVGYRLFAGVDIPGQTLQAKETSTNDVNQISPVNNTIQQLPRYSGVDYKKSFIDNLLSQYRPRLAAYLHTKTKQFGLIEFYQDDIKVEQFTIKELHSLGIAVVHKEYGVDLVTHIGTTIVTPWALQRIKKPKQDNNIDEPQTIDNDQQFVTF